MNALVRTALCPLMLHPSRACPRADEALLGMAVELLEESCPGWFRVRTHYGYTGYAPRAALLPGEENLRRWAALPKAVVRRGLCDVLCAPSVDAPLLLSVTRGALLAPRGEPSSGWQRVSLPDGREGYLPVSLLGQYYIAPLSQDESVLRSAIVDAALSYLGTSYRWGGKTPLGIDCSGLAFMAYLLCGVVIWRDAALKEGYPLHAIPPAEKRPGDLLYFPGHVAVYLGEERYVHATARPGSDGVVINSLSPNHSDYRPDLAQSLTAVGSLFPLRSAQ